MLNSVHNPPKLLTSEQIQDTASYLNIPIATLKAVIDVESSGYGYVVIDDNVYVKTLFEGHIFWSILEKNGIDPLRYTEPDILYKQWTKNYYGNELVEITRLYRACRIDTELALMSASYGLFQIMGFNYSHCSFASVMSFLDAQRESELEQLRTFCNYIINKGLLIYLQHREWSSFAYHYNGSSYNINRYDIKLQESYEKYINNP